MKNNNSLVAPDECQSFDNIWNVRTIDVTLDAWQCLRCPNPTLPPPSCGEVVDALQGPDTCTAPLKDPRLQHADHSQQRISLTMHQPDTDCGRS